MLKDRSTKLIQKSVNFNETTRRHIPYKGSLRNIGGFTQVRGHSPYCTPWLLSSPFFFSKAADIYTTVLITHSCSSFKYMYLLQFSKSVRLVLKGYLYNHTYEPKIKLVQEMQCQHVNTNFKRNQRKRLTSKRADGYNFVIIRSYFRLRAKNTVPRKVMTFNLNNFQVNVVLYLSILQSHDRRFQPIRLE